MKKSINIKTIKKKSIPIIPYLTILTILVSLSSPTIVFKAFYMF